MSSDVSWHIRDKLRPMPKHGSILLYVHGNQKARWDGQLRTATSTFTHSSWTMCFTQMDEVLLTSTETGRLVRTDSPGRQPRLSHSSWTMTDFMYEIKHLVHCLFIKGTGVTFCWIPSLWTNFQWKGWLSNKTKSHQQCAVNSIRRSVVSRGDVQHDWKWRVETIRI